MNRVLMLILVFALNGCYAGIKAYPASTSKGKEGIRYFLAASYLVVERTGDGDTALWDARFETLPDTSHPFSIQPYTLFAKQDATIELHPDGTLKSVVLTQDATAVSGAVVEAVKEVSLKKLELQKAAAEAERSREAVADKDEVKKREEVKKRVWVFHIRGSKAKLTTPTSSELTFPRLKAGEPEASGKIEGTFSVPVGAIKIEGGGAQKGSR